MPIIDAHSIEFISRSPEQTRRVGMRLGSLLRSGDLICLNGDLGAGKTTFVQGLAAGWGSPDAVSSPTFVLVNVYRHPADGNLYHLDAYRLSGPAEAIDLDLDTMLADGPMVVEWAERVRGALPEEHLRLALNYVDEDQRDMIIRAHGPRYESLLAEFRKQLYGT
ncbi:MAG: tRNA (adenosine(37)-N6)-threonylcarbamoyltransferase complex ATPase subunit type 1 TsaE [Chloroflexota bacterium]